MSTAPQVTESSPTTGGPPAEAGQPAEGLSIVIPAYNEEGGIAPVLEELRDLLAELDLDLPVEVIIVNDGSKDATDKAIEPFVGELFRLLNHRENRGYGAALKTGIRHAKHPWILITDADGTYPNAFLPDLLTHRDTHEMVVGARTGEKTHIPLLRRPPKWVLRTLASRLSGQRIPDLNSGFRLMRKEVVERYFHILPDGFSFTTTITLAMFSDGYQVRYVPIDYHRRAGKSKIRPIADTIGFLKLIFRTMIYFDPLRVFIPVAFAFFVSSAAVGFGSWYWLGNLMDVTTVLLFVTGVQVLTLAMVADMINRRLR